MTIWRVRIACWISKPTDTHSYIHSIFCLTTGPKPPPKRFLHIVRSRARYVSPFHRPRKPLGRVEVQLYSILDLCTRRGWGVSVTPRQQLTPGKDPVPVVQEAGWASGPVWTGAENLAPPGFDPRTVQPVGSRYTDYATRPTDIELPPSNESIFSCP